MLRQRVATLPGAHIEERRRPGTELATIGRPSPNHTKGRGGATVLGRGGPGKGTERGAAHPTPCKGGTGKGGGGEWEGEGGPEIIKRQVTVAVMKGIVRWIQPLYQRGLTTTPPAQIIRRRRGEDMSVTHVWDEEGN